MTGNGCGHLPNLKNIVSITQMQEYVYLPDSMYLPKADDTLSVGEGICARYAVVAW